MAFANPSTFVAGNVLTAAQMNVLANNDRFLHGPPKCKLHHTVTFNIGTALGIIGTATGTTAVFDTEIFDSDNMHSSTAPGRIMIRTAGTYLVGAQIGFSDGSTTLARLVGILRSGSDRMGQALIEPSTASGTSTPVTTLSTASTSDYFEIQVQTNASTNVDLLSFSQTYPVFWAIWMSS